MKEESYRCSMCGMRFNFVNQKDQHVYKEHPEIYLRDLLKENQNSKTQERRRFSLRTRS